ncbi:MAG: hypothetical protein AAF618_00025 [Pseudomonadota bacterium]
MTIICISDVHSGEEFISGASLAIAAKKAVEARVGEVKASQVTPKGGTHYHIVDRELEPEQFWLAQLSHSMTDDELFGWGDTEEEARAHAKG